MRELPEKLTTNQRKYTNLVKQYGLLPTDPDFWSGWDGEGLSNETPAEKYEGTTRKSNPTKSAAIAAEELSDRKRRESELVLSTLYGFDTISIRNCKHCRLQFATNYNYERYCSDLCRTDALRDRGIKWDSSKSTEDRWMGQPPSTISPATLVSLKKWAHKILADKFDDAVDNAIASATQEVDEAILLVAELQLLETRPVTVVRETVPSKKKFDWMD